MYAYTVNNGGLQYVPKPEPTPEPGQVSITVHTAGLGLIDALWTIGAMPSNPDFVPGLEVSGTVRALGEGVNHLAEGQLVAAILPAAGGFAEVVCTPATLVAPIPQKLDHDLAAVVPINTVTAHLALTTVARLAESESLLVNAGVGGLGSQFQQVAQALGAGPCDAVVGTPEKQALALECGYRTAYLRSELRDIPDGTYDIVVDPVGGDATTQGFRVLRSGGRLVRVGNASQAPDVEIGTLALWLENKTAAGFNVGAWLAEHPADGTDSLAWSLEAVARGDVRVDLTAVGGHEQLPQFLEALERGETTGKLAVRFVSP